MYQALLAAESKGRYFAQHIRNGFRYERVRPILSIIETCRRLALPVREYLAAVLPGLADTSLHKLPQLTPVAWAASHH